MRPNKKQNAQKKQKKSYSGKHKCHTIKNQIVINGSNRQILCAHEAKGAVHDFELFKRSGIHTNDDILDVADKGYNTIHKIHRNSLIPFKKPRNGELTPEQKAFNRNLASYRIRIEHVNRRLKCFKILQQRYRNKQRKHFLRFSLICGLYNYNMGF